MLYSLATFLRTLALWPVVPLHPAVLPVPQFSFEFCRQAVPCPLKPQYLQPRLQPLQSQLKAWNFSCSMKAGGLAAIYRNPPYSPHYTNPATVGGV
jgi:hypothetical protein